MFATVFTTTRSEIIYRHAKSSPRLHRCTTGYVVLQKPQEQADRLPPPRTLILDFTLTHTRYGSSHVTHTRYGSSHTTGQLTNTRRSDGAPSLMVLYGRWIGKRFHVIANCILIVQTPCLFYRLQLILQVLEGYPNKGRPGIQECLDPDMHVRFHAVCVKSPSNITARAKTKSSWDLRHINLTNTQQNYKVFHTRACTSRRITLGCFQKGPKKSKGTKKKIQFFSLHVP